MLLTKLEKGILVEINHFELSVLKNEKGFLSREAYHERYEEIALKNEVGRYMIFRILTKNEE